MAATRGSQYWLQRAVNEHANLLDAAVRGAANLPESVSIEWLSPKADDLPPFAEYRDAGFLSKLNLTLRHRPLESFWPRRGAMWDGLARTSAGEVLLVEGKAHIPEMVSSPTAAGPASLSLIEKSLEETRKALAPRSTMRWSGTFYQYTNRLAHLYLLRTLNRCPARLVFVDFINATDVNGPTSVEEWHGAIKVVESYLGLGAHKLSPFIHHVFVDVRDLSSTRGRT